MIFDDHPVPRRTLEEIEAEATRCRSYADLDAGGRIDLNQLLSALHIRLVPKSERYMADNEAYSDTAERQIVCRRSVSSGLRFGDPEARYVIAHELGHYFLHRGSSPKARKVGGNKTLSFIDEEDSAESQAWKFARALFVARDDLLTAETDEAIAIRVGLPTRAVAERREEVNKAVKARQPKTVLPFVRTFLERTRTASKDPAADRAWELAAQIEGEDPSEVRSARGFRIEWHALNAYDSQVGWTIHNGEARSLMDLKSR